MAVNQKLLVKMYIPGQTLIYIISYNPRYYLFIINTHFEDASLIIATSNIFGNNFKNSNTTVSVSQKESYFTDQ